MKVVDAARAGRIKIHPDGKGGVYIDGRRRDVVSIAKSVQKRERRNAKRLAQTTK